MKKLAKPGLGHVLKEVCGIDTDKALASSDWRRRPLTDSQLYYSILDVSFLEYIAASLLDLLMDMDTAAVSSHAAVDPAVAVGNASELAFPPHPGGGLATADAGASVHGTHELGEAEAGPSAADGSSRQQPAELRADATGIESAVTHQGGVVWEHEAKAHGNDTSEGGGAPGQQTALDDCGKESDGLVRVAAAWKRSQKLCLALYKPGGACCLGLCVAAS